MTALEIDAPPSEVRARLQGALHRTDGLWFNSGDGRRAWVAASAPLYIQWTAQDRARIGPRLGSPDVSRFVPQWHVRLVPNGGGSTLTLATRYDPLTAGLGLFWAVMLVLGGLFVTAQVRAEEIPAGAMGWWVFLVIAAGLVAGVSAVMGGRTLRASEPWLREVLETPAVEEEWV